MKPFNFSKSLAIAFCAITLSLLVWAAFNVGSITSHIDGNIFSLLPKSDRNQLAKEFIDRISKVGEKSLVILIGSDSLETSLEAEKSFKASIADLPVTATAPEDYSGYISKLIEHKSGFVTPKDIDLLEDKSAAFWVDKSNALAYSMGGSAIPWKEDPFDLLGDWIYELGKATKVRPYGDSLVVEQSGNSYVVIPLQVNDSVNSIHAQNVLADSLIKVIGDLKGKHQKVEVTKSGVIFFAANTSKSIEKDISLIGLISSIAAVVLILSVFRSAYAVGIVAITVSIAFLYAVLACYFIFPKIYLLTLAFGTSLIGMSADYCLYWLTASINDNRSPLQRRRYLLPGMFLALITTAMGYLLMVSTPFPILSQMAVFSITGICAAWFTVILLFPYLGKLNFAESKLALGLEIFLALSINVSKRLRVILIICMFLISLYGALTFKVDDNIKSMANLDSGLVAEQIKASNILGMPSPSQFFIVSTPSEEETLVRVEKLTTQLDKLISDGSITGYQAVTRYLPSATTQQAASAAYVSPNKISASQQVAKQMGLDNSWIESQNKVSQPLTIEGLRDLPIFQKLSYLWFDSAAYSGKSTAILLAGVSSSKSVEALAQLADKDVSWVNKTQEVSEEFSRYRSLFSIVIAIGYLLTFIAIFLRYKGDAWRAIAPPVLATFIALAILTSLGESISLLSVIAFALLLGIGTDYGIFLLQYPGDRKVLLSITIAALMTLISFGSLAFSRVPALHSFGIALLFGVFLSWLLTIFFAKQVRDHA